MMDDDYYLPEQVGAPVFQVSCPLCKSSVGYRCRLLGIPKDDIRDQPHQERIEKYHTMLKAQHGLDRV